MRFILRAVAWLLLIAPVYQSAGQEADWITLALSGDLQSVEQWIDAGGDLNVQDENGASLIMWAAYGQNLELVKHLIAKGADTEGKGVIWLDENQQSYVGNLQSIASYHADIPMLRYLVEEAGLDIDAREWSPSSGQADGWRAVQWAVSLNYPELLTQLLEMGAQTENETDGNSLPLVMAIGSSQELLVRILDCYGVAGKEMAVELTKMQGDVYLTEYLSNGSCDREAIEKWMEADALHKRGVSFYQEGKYQEAIPLLEEAAQRYESSVGDKHPQYAFGIGDLAETLRLQAEYDKAEPLFKESLAVYKESLGENSVQYALSLNNLGSLYYSLGRYRETKPIFEEVVVRFKALVGDKHFAYGTAVNNLAGVLDDLGHIARAESLYHEALAVRKVSQGETHPEYAGTLNNLAFLYQKIGRYDDADSLFSVAGQILKDALGEEHGSYVTNLNNRGVIARWQDKYREAERLHLKAAELHKAILGDAHPDYATSLSNLGLLYLAQGRYTEAEKLINQALTIVENAIGKLHPHYANSLSALSEIMRAQGRYDQAEGITAEEVEIRQAVYGESHPDFAKSLHNLAIILEAQGRYAEAEANLRRAMGIMKEFYSENHTEYALLLSNLAVVFQSQRRFDDAQPLYEQSIEIQENFFGEEHTLVAQGKMNLAGLFEQKGQFREAEEHYLSALAVDKKVLGEEHPYYALDLNNLAILYERQGRYVEAQLMQEDALFLRRKINGNAHPHMALSQLNLAKLGRKSRLISNTEVIARLDTALHILSLPANKSQEPEWFIRSLRERGFAHYANGNRMQAFADLNMAIRLFEEQRLRVGGSESIQAGYFDSFLNLYTTMAIWMIENDQLEEANVFLERGRARALVDQLQASGTDYRLSIPEPQRSELKERELEAVSLLTEFNTSLRSAAADDSEMDVAAHAEYVDALTRKRDSIRVVLEQIDNESKNASMFYQETIGRGMLPPSIEQLRELVVPANGFLLNYIIGTDSSYVLAIGPETLWAAPLVLNEEDADSLGVKAGHLYQAKLDSILVGDIRGRREALVDLLREENLEDKRIAIRNRQLHALFDVLIPESRKAQLMASEELVIVPSGNLNALPFEALITELGQDKVTYWIDEGPLLRYGPSASVLETLASRKSEHTNMKPVLSLSNPNYDAVEYEPLLYSQNETEALVSAYGPSAVEVLTAEHANETALRSQIANRRIIHIAAHGITESRGQGMFSAIVLSAPDSASASQENDGLLELREIYQLEDGLRNTSLAVLSACETNVGPQFQGEGVFALSRGFLTMGTKRVLASQWAVKDQSTGLMMQIFFRALKNGKDHALALREAQLAVRKNDVWSDPRFWAPFILIGGR